MKKKVSPISTNQPTASPTERKKKRQSWSKASKTEYKKIGYEKHAANVDNKNLESRYAGGLVIGYVDEINGPSSSEIPEFDPTRHELLQLVKYWTKVKLDDDYFFFFYGQTGSSEMRRSAFAIRRVGRIADLLGDKEVRQAIHEMYEEFGRSQDPRVWQIFLHGTAEQREQFREEIRREIDRQNDEESSKQPR